MRNDLGDHRLLYKSAVVRCVTSPTYRYRVPRTDKDPVECLVCPKFPYIVKAEGCLGDPNATPCRKHEDKECVLQVSRRIVTERDSHTTSNIVFVRMTHRFWMSQKTPTLYVNEYPMSSLIDTPDRLGANTVNEKADQVKRTVSTADSMLTNSRSWCRKPQLRFVRWQ